VPLQSLRAAAIYLAALFHTGKVTDAICARTRSAFIVGDLHMSRQLTPLDAIRKVFHQNPKIEAKALRKKLDAMKEKGIISRPSPESGRVRPRKAQTSRPKRPASVMPQRRFWALIEDARLSSSVCSALTAALKKLAAEEIIGFEHTLRRKLALAYVFPLLAANYVIESYVSDDVFESFRAWLVSQGRQRFEAALSDPESICDWLDRKGASAVDRQGERMLFVAQNAFKRYGDEEDFFNRTDHSREPAFEQSWPRTKAEFRKRYVDKFWNQTRINKLNA
jgi:hypothetical protein